MASAVQHVTKASSDQLLRKFADESSPARAANSPRALTAGRLAVRRKRSRRALAALSARELSSSSSAAGAGGEIVTGRRRRRRMSGGMAEWKSLLPTAAPGCRRRSAAASMLRRMGIEDAEGIRSFLVALEKTWRRTVEGASRMFIEKHHCDNHLQLISDIV